VTWEVTRTAARGPVIVDKWYAVLPIAEHITAPRTHGIVALELLPRIEGRYAYAVRVEDTRGATSNVLYKTITVVTRTATATCPRADPILPKDSSPPVKADPG